MSAFSKTMYAHAKLVWMTARLVACTFFATQQLSAQLIFTEGDGATMKPFEAPDASDRLVAKQNHLRASLRFGYLSDDKAAEALRRRTEYNEQGFPTTTYDFATDGKIEAKKEYTYDASGTKILSSNVERYSKVGDLMYMLQYHFDSEGRILEYRELNAQGHERRMVYTYGAQNKLLRLQYIEPDGLPGGAEVYTYDLPNKRASMEKSDIAGDLIERVTWTLDAKGRIATENRYTGGETPILLYTYAFTYDPRGHLIRKEKMSRDLVPSGSENWTYDSRGHLTERKIQETGEEKPSRETFKYDQAGRVTETIYYNGDGSIFTWHKYKYDSLGTGAGMQRLLPDGKVDYEKVTVYNKRGQIISALETYPDGTGAIKIQYRYEADGLPLEEKHFEMGEENAVFWFVHERY